MPQTIRPMGRKLFVFITLIFIFLISSRLNAVEAISCKDPTPGGPPVLTSAVAGNTSVKLTWTEAPDPVSYYLVTYGTSQTDREYGFPNVGPKGTASFTVEQLSPGIKYYFQVRAVNGCKGGKLSNKLSAVTGFKTPSSAGSNLSIYETDSTGNGFASTEEDRVMGASSSVLPTTCQRCMGWQLLGAEILLLVAYFLISSKFRAFNKIGSVFIPMAVYLLFLKINGSCPSNNFFCNYFLQLNILIFIFFVIAQKYKTFHPKPAI